MVRILILEDDQDMRELLARLLRKDGHTVDAAARGAEAVEKAQQTRYDLLISDIRMEGIDGLEALARVRERQPDLQGLVITGYSTEADSVRAINLGVAGYLRKPFQLDDFLGAVNRIVENIQRQREEQARQQALQETVLWALESVARSLDLSRPLPVALVTLGRRAYQACRRLGSSEEAAREAQMALLARSIRQREPELEAGFLLRGLPQSATFLLRQLESDETTLLPAQVVRLLGEHGADAPPEGRFDPRVVAAVEQAFEEGDAPAASDERRSDLLAVAQVQLGAGDYAGARATFDEMLSRPHPPAHLAGHLVDLARMALKAGEAEAARHYLNRAVELAERLSLARGAVVRLEAGLLFRRRELLEQALPLLEQAARARATLALQAARESCEDSLELLLQPRFLPDLVDSAEWLLPLLLEHPGPLRTEAAERIVRQAPAHLLDAVRAGLSRKARLGVLDALASTGRRGHEETLRLLCGDEDSEVSARAAEILSQETRQSAPPILRLYSFGMFEVYLADWRVPEESWHTQKVRYLLALLASRRGSPLNQDLVLEEFWPESPGRSKKYLYQTTSHLRRALTPPGWDDGPDYVVRGKLGLCLSPELPRWHDLEELEKAVDSGREFEEKGDVMRAVEALRVGLDLYRGPYLDGCYMEWAVALRSSVERTVMEAFTRMIAGTETLGRHHETLEVSNRMLELDPYRQDAHLAAMEACISLGRPEDALRQFERCEKILKRDLDIEPTIDLLRSREKARMNL